MTEGREAMAAFPELGLPEEVGPLLQFDISAYLLPKCIEYLYHLGIVRVQDTQLCSTAFQPQLPQSERWLFVPMCAFGLWVGAHAFQMQRPSTCGSCLALLHPRPFLPMQTL